MATAKRRAKPKTKSAAVAKLSLHDLKPPLGSHRARIRKGRGPGSGIGKAAGRGGKGQTARSGGAAGAGCEGGRDPLVKEDAGRQCCPWPGGPPGTVPPPLQASACRRA